MEREASSLATSLLDEIVSQVEFDNANPLYRLANYRKGGRLVEGYLKGGSKELERMAAEEMKDYMYREGNGEVLDDIFFKKWREENDNQVVIPMDEAPSADVVGTKPRVVCWKLDYRGLLGESLLHVLVLCNTDVHSRMADILVKLFPALSKDIVEGEEYYGATALHFAIAYENCKLVKNLVESGANVMQRATGKFFLPTDQQWPIPRKKTNFEGLSYLGEYPLAWAACCEDESSYNILLMHGADPNMQDSFGNSILHVVVVRDKLKMYGYALRHPTKPSSDLICNKFGLTPLTLACKLGRNKIFREMLELSSSEFWRYSNITCSGYPLNALDSLQPNGKTNLNSALMIILNGSTNEHLDMLDGGVIQRLLEEKWKTFAQRCFYRRLFVMMFHLLNLSIAVFLRPTTKEPLWGETDASTVMRYCAEIGTCIGCVGFAIFQQAQEIAAQGFTGSLLNMISSPSKTAFVISCLLILSCIPCRVVGDRSTEDFLLVLAIPGSWFFLIFFAGAVRLTGPFVTMIYSMLVGDMFRFSLIYLIFLFGFSQAFYFLFKNPPIEKPEAKKRFSTFPVTWMGLFHMTLGSYEYDDFRETFYQKLTQMVFAMFMVFSPILLLNMLIAMMGNTYCEVITQSEKEWVKQWAKIVVVLERAIDHKSAREYIQTYSIKMTSGDKDDPDNEVRGVICIKSKPKSKAKEKKEALSLWKRLGKRTVHELRIVGGSAAGVRKKYNLFRSKQPTARLHMGVVIQEWIPVEAPPIPTRLREDDLNKSIFARDIQPLEHAPPLFSGSGLGDLLSQVTSATGADIGVSPNRPVNAPTEQQSSAELKTAEECEVAHQQFITDCNLPPPPKYDECMEEKTAFVSIEEYDNHAFIPDDNSQDYGRSLQSHSSYSHSGNRELFVMSNEVQVNKVNFALHHASPLMYSIPPRPRLHHRAISFDVADDIETPDHGLPKIRSRRPRSSKKKKRKRFLNKFRIEDVNPPNSDESSDDQQSICVNVKTRVSTRLSSARPCKRGNKCESIATNLNKIEECSENSSAESRFPSRSFNLPRNEEFPLTVDTSDVKQDSLKKTRQKRNRKRVKCLDRVAGSSRSDGTGRDFHRSSSMAWEEPTS